MRANPTWLVVFLVACSAAPARSTINLDLHAANLTETLRAIAADAGVNLFVDPHLDEAGSVTLRVRARPWDAVLATLASEHQLRVETLDVRGAERPALWITRTSDPPAPVTTFAGERVTARFDDTPIREVAAELARTAKVPITVDDDLQVAITLHLRLPWDLALYHLAQKYELRIERGNGAIRIRRR